MTTPPAPDAPIERSLYDTLDERMPATVAAGETSLTATKETLDADSEDVSDDDILNL